MFNPKFNLVLALVALSAITGSNAAALERRQAKAVKCGTVSYTAAQVQSASDEGCKHAKANTKLGRNNYPHPFKNFEKLAFPVTTGLQEFPLLTSGVYTGGAPGPDRVAFTVGTANCTVAGAMTHTGAAKKNSFVLCV